MTILLAHGLGGSTDLPIPYTYALIGAAWALALTFGVVALAWKTPRFDPDNPGRPLLGWVTATADAPATKWVAGGLGLAFAVWVIAAGLLGPDSTENPLPGAFYVLLWVGLVAVSVLFGPVGRALSPLRMLYRLIGRPAVRPGYPASLGYVPAAAGLFAFVWLELASPDPGSLTAIKIWILGYAAITFAGAVLRGEQWFANADPFEVYSTAVSKLSPLRRSHNTGRVVIGNPLDHLPSLPIRRGTIAVLSVLLGSTAYDSFSAMPAWRTFVDDTSAGPWTASLIRTAGLGVFVAVVAATFWFAARATGGVDRDTKRALPGLMAHSLIPIVVGYIFAHYLSYLVEKGQQTVILLVGADVDVSYVLSQHPAVLSSLKVISVLAGHVVAVLAAHDTALRVLPERHRLTGQLAMMLTMVAYTFMGLYLLFGG